MNIVFCLPGRSFSGLFLQCWTNLVGACQQNGINLILSQRYNSNVYYVRAQSLGADVLAGKNQPPFGGKINYDYIMWIDSDIIFRVSDFFTILKHGDKDIVSGLYLMDGGKQYAVVKSWDEEYFTKHGSFQFLEPADISSKKELLEVSYSGMGFMLIKRGVYENIEYPWFEPQHFTFQQNVSDFASEDVSFCKKAQEKGFKIYVDTSVIVGHEKSHVLI